MAPKSAGAPKPSEAKAAKPAKHEPKAAKAKGGDDDKASKANSRAQKAADEEARRAAREQMLAGPGSDDDGGSAEDEAPRRPTGKAPTLDKFGNTASKAGASESAKTAELELARAEARARREAKAAKDTEEDSAGSGPVDLVAKRVEETAALRAKAAAGGKLSNKEKKLLSQLDSRVQDEAAEVAEIDSGLSAFSLSVRGSTVAEGEEADKDSVSATDVIVPCFSVNAPARVLFRDASLRLASGRR
ncbi:hypothetical protein T492DRAFT_868964 [Pavlovales sp. CCMP2436]|nr:hypothetical protein T492DRAFT_868964 [Pavlovales sp. CCMP2436]